MMELSTSCSAFIEHLLDTQLHAGPDPQGLEEIRTTRSTLLELPDGRNDKDNQKSQEKCSSFSILGYMLQVRFLNEP